MNARELRARGTKAPEVRVWLATACALCIGVQVAHAQSGNTSEAIAATQLRPAVSARAPQQPVKPAATEARSEREAALRTASQKLASSDAEAMQQALTELSALGGKDAAAPVIARLRRGLPPQLVDASIEALVKLKEPSAIPALLELATHRRYQVRAHAVDALGALSARNAEAVLLYALDDPSGDVREAAVRSLGKVGTRRAIKPLLAAHERGVQGALGAVGSLGSSQEAELLMARAKAGQLDAAAPGLQAQLLRSNVMVATKTKIIATLRELDSPAAQSCLSQTLAALGDKGDPRLKLALQQALGTPAPGAAAPAAPAPAVPQAAAQAPAQPAKSPEVAK